MKLRSSWVTGEGEEAPHPAGVARLLGEQAVLHHVGAGPHPERVAAAHHLGADVQVDVVGVPDLGQNPAQVGRRLDEADHQQCQQADQQRDLDRDMGVTANGRRIGREHHQASP